MPPIVSKDEWLTARKALLTEEKAFNQARDALSSKRRALPMVAVEKDYVFNGAKGDISLAELFGGKSQLIVYHFMYGPDWEEGCVSCSFWADNFDNIPKHLAARDAGFAVVSRAPYPTLAAYQKRMGWSFPWVSAFDTSFNTDFNVSFTQEQKDAGKAVYNYQPSSFPSDEAPGISVFSRDGAGNIFHTYSTYSRGLDMLNGAYHYLDLLPKGRDEAELPWPMAWLKRRDDY